MINSRDMERKHGKMVLLMRENIRMERNKEEDYLNGVMEICILVILNKIRWMVMGYIIGRVEKYMMGIGRRIEWKVKE